MRAGLSCCCCCSRMPLGADNHHAPPCRHRCTSRRRWAARPPPLPQRTAARHRRTAVARRRLLPLRTLHLWYLMPWDSSATQCPSTTPSRVRRLVARCAHTRACVAGGSRRSAATGARARRSRLERLAPPLPRPITHAHASHAHKHTHTDRVDRLRPEEQLALKVAAVLGLTAYTELLQASSRLRVCGCAWGVCVGGCLRLSALPHTPSYPPTHAASPTHAPPTPRLAQATHPRSPSLPELEGALRGLEAANFMRQDGEHPSTWRFCQARWRARVCACVRACLRACVPPPPCMHIHTQALARDVAYTRAAYPHPPPPPPTHPHPHTQTGLGERRCLRPHPLQPAPRLARAPGRGHGNLHLGWVEWLGVQVVDGRVGGWEAGWVWEWI